MKPCPSCGRHLIHAETSCPFCGTSISTPVSRLMRNLSGGLLAAVTPLVLAACYGPAFKDTDSAPEDLDGDGFSALVDCNDDDAAVNPEAAEVCDDTIDNDCDSAIDADDDDCTLTQ